jgi:large subunit ribosomal protein L24
MHIRKGDQVTVITGDDADPKLARRVLRVVPSEGKVVVEGVNRVYKHLKPSRRNPQGGRLSKEMAIDVSNVLLYCTNCQRGVRVGHRYAADGKKERHCKKCDATFRVVSKARPAYIKAIAKKS